MPSVVEKNLLARLDALQVTRKLKHIARQYWRCGHIIRGTAVDARQYTAYISLVHDYNSRCVRYRVRDRSTLKDEWYTKPAEGDEDYLSEYGRVSARYVKGKKRTHLCVAALTLRSNKTEYLIVSDDQSGGYWTDLTDGIARTRLHPFSITINGTEKYDGLRSPVIELGNEDDTMTRFLDHWLDDACLQRSRSNTMPKALEDKARAIIKKPDHPRSFLNPGHYLDEPTGNELHVAHTMGKSIEALQQEVDRLEEATRSMQGFQSKTLQHSLALTYQQLAEALVSAGRRDEAVGAFSDADACFKLADEPYEAQKMRTRMHQLL